MTFFENDYEVVSYGTDGVNVRVDVRLTQIAPTALQCLVLIREKIDEAIFQQRLYERDYNNSQEASLEEDKAGAEYTDSI